MDEVRLSADAAILATEITSIDRRIDDLDRVVTAYIAQGLRFGGAMNRRQRAIDDAERQRLMDRRAELVEQLKSSVSER